MKYYSIFNACDKNLNHISYNIINNLKKNTVDYLNMSKSTVNEVEGAKNQAKEVYDQAKLEMKATLTLLPKYLKNETKNIVTLYEERSSILIDENKQINEKIKEENKAIIVAIDIFKKNNQRNILQDTKYYSSEFQILKKKLKKQIKALKK